MVLILCAMVITVHSLNALRMVDWMTSSVWTSIEAVASSRSKIFDFLSKALAKHTSCLWPTLQDNWKCLVMSWRELGPSTWIPAWVQLVSFIWQKEKKSPHLRLSPLSPTSYSNFSTSSLTKSLRWACSRASHRSASDFSPLGSRLSLRVPPNNTESWHEEKQSQKAHTVSVHQKYSHANLRRSGNFPCKFCGF